MTGARHKRNQKLIKLGVQLRLGSSFVGLAAVALFLQFLFLGNRLLGSLEQLEGEGGQLAHELPATLLEVFGLSLALLLPVIFGLGIVLTFKIVGPCHRFESYLNDVAEGRETKPCTLRKGDELQSLCDAINRVTEPIRNAQPKGESDADYSDEAPTQYRKSA